MFGTWKSIACLWLSLLPPGWEAQRPGWQGTCKWTSSASMCGPRLGATAGSPTSSQAGDPRALLAPLPLCLSAWPALHTHWQGHSRGADKAQSTQVPRDSARVGRELEAMAPYPAQALGLGQLVTFPSPLVRGVEPPDGGQDGRPPQPGPPIPAENAVPTPDSRAGSDRQEAGTQTGRIAVLTVITIGIDIASLACLHQRSHGFHGTSLQVWAPRMDSPRRCSHPHRPTA